MINIEKIWNKEGIEEARVLDCFNDAEEFLKEIRKVQLAADQSAA